VSDADGDYLEFVGELRDFLGLKPLPDERIGPSRFTLDGERYLSADEWAKLLHCTSAAVYLRRAKNVALQEAGLPRMPFLSAKRYQGKVRPKPYRRRKREATLSDE